jgi:hypothetical protein
MMKRLWMSGAAAVMAISIAGVGAQTSQDPPPPTQPPTTQPPTTQPPATAPTPSAADTMTVEGCVYKAADIPGQSAAAGGDEDFVLVTGPSSSATAGTSGTTPPTGTAGTSGMMSATKTYKLEKIADERLKAVVGKRVEVTGRVDAGGSAATGTAGAPPADPSARAAQIELKEFEVSTIREVEGSCPATPQIRK